MRIGVASPFAPCALKSYLFEEYHNTAELLTQHAAASGVHSYVSGLLDIGHQVIVFTCHSNIDKDIVLRGNNLTIYVVKMRRIARLRVLDHFYWEVKKLNKLIKESNLDVIHARWTYEYALATKGLNIPAFITVEDWAPAILKMIHDFYRFCRYFMDYKVFATCKNAHFIANSLYMKNNILERWGINVPIVPNSVNNIFLYKSRKFIATEKPEIITVAQGADPLKNIAKLLEAFVIIRERISGAKLRLVGDGFKTNTDFYIQMQKKGLVNNVEFAGRYTPEQLAEALKKAQLMIHPSLEESFGLTFIEAMASGVPVIGGENSGAVPWVLNNGEAGILCNVNSAGDIAQKALDVLKNKDKWEYFSNAGFQHVVDNFSVCNIVKKTLAIYEQKLN